MDRYDVGFIYLNARFSRTYSGRSLRFESVINPTRQTIKWIYVDSPLMTLAITEAHRVLSCGLGVDAYNSQVHLSAFSGNGLRSRVQEDIDS